eukprot:2104192-Rhodomonas_salina.2
MSGTEIGYAAVIFPTSGAESGYSATPLLCDVRVLCTGSESRAMLCHAYCAMSGTHIAYYAMSGTHIAYGGRVRSLRARCAMSGTDLACGAICLRACYAMSGLPLLCDARH